MTTPSPSDPSGFLTGSQPSTIVKVINTAREDMNNKLGIVVQFNQDRARYLVHLTENQSVVAMKPENLVKAGYLEQAQAQFQQLTQDPRIRQQLQQFQQRFLPPGIQVKHVAMGAAAVFVALVFLLGFSRTMMILSFGLLVLMIVGPDLVQGATLRTMAQNLPMRFRTFVREQVPGGTTIANNNAMLAGLALLMLLFFGKAMLTSPASRKAAAVPPMNLNPDGNTMMGPRRNVNVMNDKIMEDFYKLGWDDAQAQKDYGTSLEVERKLQQQTTYDEYASSDFSSDLADYLPPPPQSSMMSKVLSFSNAMSMMYIGRTLMDLGRDADGSWSFALMQQNLTTLEPWKLGMMGFSVYRLVSAFLF